MEGINNIFLFFFLGLHSVDLQHSTPFGALVTYRRRANMSWIMYKEPQNGAKERAEAVGQRRNRGNSNAYYLNGKQICKIMFHKTLDVSEQFVKTCLSKAVEGVICSSHSLVGKRTNDKVHFKGYTAGTKFFFRVKISSPFLVHHVGKSTIYNMCSFRKNILPNLISLSWWYIQHIFKVSHAQFWHLWKFIRSEFFSIASLNWSKRS